MAKYAKYQRKSPEKKGQNPIWRGIGCILIFVSLVFSYWMMTIFVPIVIATGKVPYQLLGFVHFPEWAFKLQITADIARFISSLDNLGISLITYFVILLLVTAVASFLYALIYPLVGPTRYTELDAPPTKYKGKKYTR
jgi:hypothetical protein